MAVEREALRDWHRLFGLLLTDFFTDSPFRIADIEILPGCHVRDWFDQFCDLVALAFRGCAPLMELLSGIDGIASSEA